MPLDVILRHTGVDAFNSLQAPLVFMWVPQHAAWYIVMSRGQQGCCSQNPRNVVPSICIVTVQASWHASTVPVTPTLPNAHSMHALRAMCVGPSLAVSPPSWWAHAHLPYSWLCSKQINDIAGIGPSLTQSIQKHDKESVAWHAWCPIGQGIMCILLHSWLCNGY